MSSGFRRWLENYENSRHSRAKQPREPSETFVSSKYDFQNNDPELRRQYIPELGMTVGSAISSLKKSWKMYRHNLAEGEPTDQLSLRLLKLQAGLGLEQTGWLKDELVAMGYTQSEIEENSCETETEDSELTDLDRRLLAEEQRENNNNNNWGDSEEESNQETETLI
jgi:hypothetical protein